MYGPPKGFMETLVFLASLGIGFSVMSIIYGIYKLTYFLMYHVQIV